MNSIIRSLASLTLICILSLSALAQGTTGSIRGVVTDPRGGVIRDARVVLLLLNRVAVRETRTNERGEFYFVDLKPGEYSISVEAAGLTQTGGAQPVKVEAGRDLAGIVTLNFSAIEDRLIVSATRTDSRLSETSMSAFVASGADLLRAQRISVFDALRASPGVTVVQTARRGGVASLFLRGGESDYTKVLIDGVPANDAGGSFDLADLTTDNAAQVELVRGAQSAIYGSDAISGVLQFFTRRGVSSTPEFEFTGEGGSFAFNRQFARLSGLYKSFDYSAGFTHLRTDGRDRNDDYQNRIATANLGYRFNERTQLRLTTRNETSGAGVPGATAFLFPDPDERIERKRIALGARLEDQTTKYWRQSLTFAFSENNQNSFDPVAQDLSRPGTPVDTFSAFNDFSSNFNNHQRRRGVRYQSDYIIESGHFISAGIDYEQESAVFDNGFAGINRVASERTNTGIYVQDQFALGSRLFINTGLRWEKNIADLPAGLAQILSKLGSAAYTGEVGFGRQVVPKASLTWVVRQSGIQSRRGPTRLRVNYGEGIKAPTLIEAFSPNPFFLGNPGLKPERSRSFDIGIDQFFMRDRYRVEITYFDNHFRDQIAFVAEPSTFGGPVKLADGRLTHFINNDRSRSYGYEIAATARPGHRVIFSGNYTFLKTKLVSAAEVIDFNTNTLVPNREVALPLLRRPRHSGSINLTLLGNKWDLNLDGFFSGKRRDLDPVLFTRFDAGGRPIYNGGYAKLDLAGSYRVNSRLTIFLRIENLLNQDFQEVLGYRAYRLNFSGGMRIRIGGEK